MGREGPADIWDSLFPTLSGGRRIRNRNRFVLSGASRSAAVLSRSDSLGASFRSVLAALHLRKPCSGGVTPLQVVLAVSFPGHKQLRDLGARLSQNGVEVKIAPPAPLVSRASRIFLHSPPTLHSQTLGTPALLPTLLT